MAGILVFSENRNLVPELLGKGRELAGGLGGGAVGAVLLEEDADAVKEWASCGADKVFRVKGIDPALSDVKTRSDVLASIAEETEASLVLLASTRRGRELAGRLAQKLGGCAVTDVNALAVEESAVVFERYNFGGNTVTRGAVSGPFPVIASMPKSFEPAPEGCTAGQVVDVSVEAGPPGLKVVETRSKEGESVNLEDARVIVGVGKGFDKKEALEPAMELAKALGGEVGCSREPATDLGWFSEERIIGLSGKKTSPELYIGIGISGQIQHTVGILGAKCVVVVNKDKDAPFFGMADYGVVADLNEFLPKLLERLK
ncbi:MAG: electron transfer flavoprotein subunit alpha/FixB family protein [Planctomycetota bacterium]|jgi:electron transfer flavoprotein alpha subunit